MLRCAHPLAEQRRSDANQCGAFLDRSLEIARHPHRQRVDREAAGARGVEQFAQTPELSPLTLDVGGFFGDAHEPAPDESRQSGHRTRELERVSRSDAALARFAANVHLYANVQW